MRSLSSRFRVHSILRQVHSVTAVALLFPALAHGASSPPHLVTTSLPDAFLTGGADNALFGTGIANAGDVNGDGFDDVLVGAPGYTGLLYAQGRASLFLGSATGLQTAPAWTHDGDVASGEYGFAVDGAGDVNHDGFADVIVGARHATHDHYGEGAAFVYLGGPHGLSDSAVWTHNGGQDGARYGAAVAGAGDVNGDGFADILIAADRWDDIQVDRGAAWLYYGSATGIRDSAAWFGEGENETADFGQSLDGAGDVNHDGHADIVVGSWRYNSDGHYGGRTYVYFGSAMGLSATPSWHADGSQENASFGGAVAGVGDVNGDGIGDIAVGAQRYADPSRNEGAMFVFLGTPAGPARSAAWTLETNVENSRFGSSVAGAGDVNGDGVAEILGGGWGYDGSGTMTGIATLFALSDPFTGAQALLVQTGAATNDRMGTAVGGGGDINGDGYADFFTTAAQATITRYMEGAVYIHYGGPSGWHGGVHPAPGADLGATR